MGTAQQFLVPTLGAEALRWWFPDATALPPWLTAQLAGAAWLGKRATALDVDGYELVTNPEFSADVSGWVPFNVTATRVDSAVDPGVPSADADDWVLRAVRTGVGNCYAYQIITTIPGVTYALSARAYAPSANTEVNAARITLTTVVGFLPVTAENIWQVLAGSGAAAGASGTLRAEITGATIGDSGYFDSYTVQAQLAPFVVDTGWADGSICVQVPIPGSGTIPRSLWFRSTDALNGWEVRILPNTAGTDLFLYNRQAGVYSAALISADIDWTTGAVDELCVDFRGQTISLYVRKSGATVWTLAGSYASATFNQTATRHGFLAYGTASDQWNLIQLSTARQAA